MVFLIKFSGFILKKFKDILKLIMQVYECKSCGTIIGVLEEKEPLFCPLCRGKMVNLNEKMELKIKTHCPECDSIFFVGENFSPYKCAFCNYTFLKSPFRKSEERL